MIRLCLGLWLMSYILGMAVAPVRAQDNSHHEILVSIDESFYLLDVDSGQLELLLDGMARTDRFDWHWSPDGRALLGKVQIGSSPDATYFWRVYDVERRAWVDGVKIPVSQISNADWSPDGQRFTYSFNPPNTLEASRSQLWLFDLMTGDQRLLFQTPENTLIDTWGIDGVWWSPDGAHLLFLSRKWVSGGTINILNLLALDDSEETQLYRAYYGGYNPVWSPDGQWFVLRLETTYVERSGVLIETDTSEYGDLFLYDVDTGTQCPLTATPQTPEYNWVWSGLDIRFEVDGQRVAIRLDDALAHCDSPTDNRLRVIESVAPGPIYPQPMQWPAPDESLIAIQEQILDENGTVTGHKLSVFAPDGSDSRTLLGPEESWFFYWWRPGVDQR